MRAPEKECNINSIWPINTNQQMSERQERLLNDLSSIDGAISRHLISNGTSASSAKVQHERLFVFSPNTLKFRAYAVLTTVGTYVQLPVLSRGGLMVTNVNGADPMGSMVRVADEVDEEAEHRQAVAYELKPLRAQAEARPQFDAEKAGPALPFDWGWPGGFNDRTKKPLPHRGVVTWPPKPIGGQLQRRHDGGVIGI
jgi:hypothetical protein